MGPSSRKEVLFVDVAGVAPDILMGRGVTQGSNQVQQGRLVSGVQGLAPEDGEPGDVIRGQAMDNFRRYGLGEGGAVVKIPGDFVETTGTAVGTARDKKAGAYPGAVGDIIVFDGCVVHGGS